MNKILICFYLFIITGSFTVKGQNTLKINEVKITSYLSRQNLLRSTNAAAVTDSTQLATYAATSLLPGLNSVPGIRMEERSPGSYRLSLRGSLLRSPFGVRNIKVYLNEYPLTDAGGNTYINVLAASGINTIEILKGPDGSLFGANSGGVVMINTAGQKDKFFAGISGGSYGLIKEDIGITKQTGNHIFNINESYQHCDGYRQNSKLHRFSAQANDEWHYSKQNTLELLVLYSDLYYQTPGGLTQAQYTANPRLARQATATLPGAAEQKAAVYNKMIFGGITHSSSFNRWLEHRLAVFASNVDFKNPFITNFEVRSEKTYGLRTYFIISNRQSTKTFKWEYAIGIEAQQTRSAISNYQNNAGNKGSLIASGDIVNDQHFIFNRVQFDINKRFLIEAGLSINYYRYHFTDSATLTRRFDPQWMPRLAFNYLLLKNLAVRGSASRGYSPPTTAEIRPSDNNIYQQLNPEKGLNIEAGIRYTAITNKLWIDIAAYHYKLTDAIVRQQNALGEEFFINAGGTAQNGLEMQVKYIITSKKQHAILQRITLSNSSTLNDSRFTNYIASNTDYSHKNITGVPKFCFVNTLLVEISRQYYLTASHNYTSSIPLNDANVYFANPYNIVQLKAGKIFSFSKFRLELYAGIDNLLNDRYSLGNDLNAAGNRFFNAAPARNYFAGITFLK